MINQLESLQTSTGCILPLAFMFRLKKLESMVGVSPPFWSLISQGFGHWPLKKNRKNLCRFPRKIAVKSEVIQSGLAHFRLLVRLLWKRHVGMRARPFTCVWVIWNHMNWLWHRRYAGVDQQRYGHLWKQHWSPQQLIRIYEWWMLHISPYHVNSHNCWSMPPVQLIVFAPWYQYR